MNVIAINGSPHQNGTTYTAIKIITDILENNNIDTEILHMGNENVNGCAGCGKCRESGKIQCIFDDMVNECISKIETSHGLIIGSPVYYSGISGTLKCFLDRLFYCGGGNYLNYKVGCGIVTARRTGGVLAYSQINNYFNTAGIIVTPSNYFNVIHGTNHDELLQDKEGVQIIQNLGKNMAWLIKVVSCGLEKYEVPDKEVKVKTNFIRIK